MEQTATEPATDEALSAEDLAQIARQRAATYAFIARLYRVEVDQDLLDSLAATRYPARTGNDDVDHGYYLIARFMSNTWADTLTDLAVDYVRAFIGHGNNAYSAAYPYESVYTSEKRLMMQDARDEVLAIYRSCHLDKAASWKENEDHIAVELEFMQIMCERAAVALEAGDEDAAMTAFKTQRNFLDDHLYAWAGMMTTDLKKFARTDLYQGLAYLTDGFLKTDHEFLADLLDEA